MILTGDMPLRNHFVNATIIESLKGAAIPGLLTTGNHGACAPSDNGIAGHYNFCVPRDDGGRE